MLKNYLKVALRNIRRHKSYTFINIAGLSLGITCVIILFLIIKFELSFDTTHTHADRLYRVNTHNIRPTETNKNMGSPYPLARELRDNYPEVEQATTIEYAIQGLISVPVNGTYNKFLEKEGLAYVDNNFFKVFDFGAGNDMWLAGNPDSALRDPGSVVLTEKLAEKYFNKSEALGKVIRLNNSLDLMVTGVIRDFPANSDFPFTLLTSLNSQPNYEEYMDDWIYTSSHLQNYVVLKDQAQAPGLEDQFPQLITRTLGEDGIERRAHILQPLNTIHFDSDYDNFNERTISKETLGGLALIGVLLILTASINFINLATAQAMGRAKEIGVRKVLGSSKPQLVFQFLGEIFVITFISFVISLALAFLAIPSINQLLEISIARNFLNDLGNILFLIAALFAISFAAGIYPALVLSGFNPISALKSNQGLGQTANSFSGVFLRRSLIIVQFTITQIMIIGTIIIINQNELFKNKNLGFDKEAIITIKIPDDDPVKLETLHTRLTANPLVVNMSYNYGGPTSEYNNTGAFYYLETSSEDRLSAEVKHIDEHYLETYSLKLLAGNNLALKDTMSGLLINESTVTYLHIPNPEAAIGKRFKIWGEREVTGVVADFHSRSLQETVKPLIMMNARGYMREAGIKLNASNLENAIAHVETIWSETFPDYVFDYVFLNETIAKLYEKEKKLSQLFIIFSSISIFIGTMGLLGLISYLSAQKTKEVGIRKVMGASAGSIWWIFAKELGFLVLIAFLIASPIAYYFLSDWLQDYQYRVEISPATFLMVLVGTLFIALLTIAYKTYKAAMADPVRSLRREG